MDMTTRAGRSTTFENPGTPSHGFEGIWVPASPIDQVLSFLVINHDPQLFGD